MSFTNAPVSRGAIIRSIRPTPQVTAIGDSITNQCGAYSPFDATSPQATFPMQSWLMWANAYLGGRIDVDLTFGYSSKGGDWPTAYQAIREIRVLSRGSGYAPNTALPLTITAASGGTGSGAVAVAQTDGTGSITSVSVSAAGSKYSASPTVTVTTPGSGNGATFLPIVTGGGLFGIGGQTSTEIAGRVSDLAACPAQIVVVHMGTNDFNVGSPDVAKTKANIQFVVESLLSYGKQVVIIPILPRSYNMSTIKYLGIQGVNNFIRDYVRGLTAVNAQRRGGVFLCDPTADIVDAATTYGDPLAGTTQDGLHPETLGAMIIGKRLADVLKPLLSLTAGRSAAPYDNYDATYNKGGCLNKNPMFRAGAGGAAGVLGTGVVAGSVVADDWTLQRYVADPVGSTSPTSTNAVTSYCDTDAISGLTSQRLVFDFASAATAWEGYRLVGGYLSLNNFAQGDLVFAEVDVEFQGVKRLKHFQLYCSLSTSSGLAMQWACGGGMRASGLFFPNGSGRESWPNNTTFTFRTPVGPVPAAGPFVAGGPQVQTAWDASGVTGSGQCGGTIILRNFRLRKVVA